MLHLVTFQKQPNDLSKLKFGIEYIVGKTYVTFQDDFAPFFDGNSLIQMRCRYPWNSILNSCQIILAHFGYINLEDVEMRILRKISVFISLNCFKYIQIRMNIPIPSFFQPCQF